MRNFQVLPFKGRIEVGMGFAESCLLLPLPSWERGWGEGAMNEQ
jgi:hypothetical protein